MRNSAKICLYFGLLLVFSSFLHAEELRRWEEHTRLMGVDFQVLVYGEKEAPSRAAVQAAFERIEKLNEILSDYVADSEVRRLVRDTTRGKVSAELWRVLEYGQSVARETNGAFDMTVGPYVLAARQYRFFNQLPPAEKLARMKRAVGFEKLKLYPDTREVQCTVPSMRVDLGGLAKGYAVDEALRVLREQGYPRALVDGGGDLAVGDAPPGKDSWQVEVEGAAGRTMPLKNVGVATSGDVYQYVEVEGVRYSHIIDPRTGLGMTNRIQVTVIADSCMKADAWASGISVLGDLEDEGRKALGLRVFIRR